MRTLKRLGDSSAGQLGSVEIAAGQREFRKPLGRVLAGDDLEDLQRAVAKAGRDARQIRHPEPVSLGTDEADRLLAASRQPLAPMPSRERIMLAPAFHVVNVELAGFQRFERVADVIQLAAGKDVLRDQSLLGPAFAKPPPVGLRSTRDAVIQQHAAVAEQGELILPK